jgi:uncharacterized protein (DUF362 family)
MRDFSLMTTNNSKAFHVRAVHCDYRSSDEEVYQALRRATLPLGQAWEKLRRARRIAVKFNQDWVASNVKKHQGQRQQLVSDTVGRAVLRLLQEETSAEIFAVDIGIEGIGHNVSDGSSTNLMPVFKEFNIPFVDGNKEATNWVDVPDGAGLMFDRYPIPHSLTEVDALVDVQKLKNHAFMGITLCLKNLFALVSIQPFGRHRHYYHHLVRMPYMLADLGRLLNPTLNIIDGLVTQAGQEWGAGEFPRICNTLIAGDQVVATDACGAYLMGHDPKSDWLTPPFHRDRNALLIAAQSGFGTVDLEKIDFQSEVTSPVGEFFSIQPDGQETVVSWRRTTAEQGLYYQDHRTEIVAKYAGNYILMQMGKVRWADPSGIFNVSRRILSGDHPEQGMFFKYVDPEEMEGEHFQIYEKTLQEMKMIV